MVCDSMVACRLPFVMSAPDATVALHDLASHDVSGVRAGGRARPSSPGLARMRLGDGRLVGRLGLRLDQLAATTPSQ
jgi:hypothetical protein